MPLKMVSGVSMNGCIRWVEIIEGEGAVLGANVRLPIVTIPGFTIES